MNYTGYRPLLILVTVFLMYRFAHSQINVNSGTYFINTGSVTLYNIGINNNGTFSSTGGQLQLIDGIESKTGENINTVIKVKEQNTYGTVQNPKYSNTENNNYSIVFIGTSNSIITGNGTYIINNITINKGSSTASVELNCDLTISGTLLLTSGDLDIKTKTLTLGTNAIISGETNDNIIKSTAESNKGTVTTTRNLTEALTNYTFGNIGISVTTNSILGNTTVTRKFTPITVGSYTCIAKSFTILPSTNAGLNATYVLYYFGNELTEGIEPANMLLYLSTNNGVSFLEITASNNWNNGSQLGSLTTNGLNSFGTDNIWTASDYNHPLPVVLENFTSRVNGRDLILNWITSQEVNNAGFEIQYKKLNESDGDTLWKKIGFINGQGTKFTQTVYTYKQDKLNIGEYRYRLRQVDYNGNFQYFELQETIDISKPKSFEMSQNYPNPFNPVTKIDIDIPYNTKVKIILYDIAGREVKTILNEEMKVGYYTVNFNAGDLASGVYFYRIIADRYIKTLKMVIIK